MKVKNSYGLSMFLDDKTEMAGVVTKPNEESMEYAQASGSLLCRCMTESKYRQCRMHACEEEYDVCSSFPSSLIAESEFYTGIKGGSMNMMIELVKMLRNVFLMPVTVDKFDTYCVRCFDHTNDRRRAREHKRQTLAMKAMRLKLLQKHVETLKTGCGDRRVPLTLRAVLLLRRLGLRGAKRSGELRTSQRGNECNLLLMRHLKIQNSCGRTIWVNKL